VSCEHPTDFTEDNIQSGGNGVYVEKVDFDEDINRLKLRYFIRGKLPSALFEFLNLVALDLQQNAIDKMPKEIGQLSQLKCLNLFSNGLKGDIPKELTNLTRLTMIDLSKNAFNYPPPAEIIKFCDRVFGEVECRGLPPEGCDAFGNMNLSFDFTRCVQCGEKWVTAVLLIVFGILGFLGVRKLSDVINKYPNSVGETVASISILTSHSQMITVILEMKTSVPPTVESSLWIYSPLSMPSALLTTPA
jgi:hypothetical protein